MTVLRSDARHSRVPRNAPSSTKNAEKARDPEMHQTKKDPSEPCYLFSLPNRRFKKHVEGA
jgi:hypothetical protein